MIKKYLTIARRGSTIGAGAQLAEPPRTIEVIFLRATCPGVCFACWGGAKAERRIYFGKGTGPLSASAVATIVRMDSAARLSDVTRIRT